jgi:hypothetical protein
MIVAKHPPRHSLPHPPDGDPLYATNHAEKAMRVAPQSSALFDMATEHRRPA